MDEILLKNGRLLEDEFFSKKDAILIEQLRQLQRMEQTQKALSEVSGITNQSVLKHLVEIGIRPDLLATLALVPLVEVAWADGEIQADERKAILESSVKLGMGPGSVDHTLLEEWLKQKPSPKMLDAWIAYVHGLSEVLTPAERDTLKDTFLARARYVAEAAGGFLGLTSKTSAREEAMLKKLASAFSG